jgi:hypothetical protein
MDNKGPIDYAKNLTKSMLIENFEIMLLNP